MSSGGKQWIVPRSLPQLLAALEHYKNSSPLLLAGVLMCSYVSCCSSLSTHQQVDSFSPTFADVPHSEYIFVTHALMHYAMAAPASMGFHSSGISRSL